jgi:hypothetical protein
VPGRHDDHSRHVRAQPSSTVPRGSCPCSGENNRVIGIIEDQEPSSPGRTAIHDEFPRTVGSDWLTFPYRRSHGLGRAELTQHLEYPAVQRGCIRSGNPPDSPT